MVSDEHWRGWIAKHCWDLYSVVTSNFTVDYESYEKFCDIVPKVPDAGLFRVSIEFESAHVLEIREEYERKEHTVEVVNYSYVLREKTGKNILRADTEGRHPIDHMGHELPNPPHHLHDEQDRICYFTGQFNDFVERAKHSSTR